MKKVLLGFSALVEPCLKGFWPNLQIQVWPGPSCAGYAHPPL